MTEQRNADRIRHECGFSGPKYASLAYKPEIIEANVSLTGTVTAADIQGAAFASLTNCAFANAINRALKLRRLDLTCLVSDIWVYVPRLLTLIGKPKWVIIKYEVRLAERARLLRYDVYGTFQEGDFEFVPVRQSQRRAVKAATKAAYVERCSLGAQTQGKNGGKPNREIPACPIYRRV